MITKPALSNITITDGLFLEKQKLITEKTIPYIWRALNNQIEGIEPSCALDNFRIAAGDSNEEFFGLVSQDSDLFKWMEAAAYSLQFSEDAKDHLESAVGLLSRAQQKDGYLNSYYIANGLKNRWNYLKESCQLYCAGHLLEAAVADYEVTKDTKLLAIAEQYAKCIQKSFGVENGKIPGYDGHAEIELALYRLFECTRKTEYKELADYFVEQRGKKPYFFSLERRNAAVSSNLVYELEQSDYHHSQSHLPIREQREAKGHAVKAMYFYTAAADKARISGDKDLAEVVANLWDDVTSKKMYLTGAIGSTEHGEAFTYAYDLPLDTMYGETCASIGLFIFSYHMLLLTNEAKYADVMERTLYNSILVGISSLGTEFFYTNMLECDPDKIRNRKDNSHLSLSRKRWFECPCCPPNIARLLLSLHQYIYTINENDLNLQLLISNHLHTDKWDVKVTAKDEIGSTLHIVASRLSEDGRLLIRIPSWSRKLTFLINGKEEDSTIENGYFVFNPESCSEYTFELYFQVQPEKYYSNPVAHELIGKTAIMYGPTVYCAEEQDNAGLGDIFTLFLKDHGAISLDCNTLIADGYQAKPYEYGSLYSTKPPEYVPCKIKMIPYREWNNRGIDSMRVYFNER